MVSFGNILVPVDSSVNAQRALSYAGYLAELCHASVGILHVVDLSAHMSSLAQINASYMYGQVIEDLQKAGQVIIDNALKQLPPSIQAKSLLEIGPAAETIVAFSTENSYDLIVMGSRGLGAIKEFVFGSVSRYVLHRALCPVMVVK